MKRWIGVIWAAALAAAAGCASSGAPPRRGPAGDLAAALRTVAEFRGGSYRVSPADLINVTVYPDPQLNRRVRVDADGTLSLPLIGSTAVVGRTLPEAERQLERRLSAYLVSPHVSLVVEEFGNRQVFVLGEVQNPGPYPIPAGPRLTALQAVTAAGGFTAVAAPHRTLLLRYTERRSVDRVINLKDVTRGHSDRDVIIEPNDILYVPQSFF